MAEKHVRSGFIRTLLSRKLRRQGNYRQSIEYRKVTYGLNCRADAPLGHFRVAAVFRSLWIGGRRDRLTNSDRRELGRKKISAACRQKNQGLSPVGLSGKSSSQRSKTSSGAAQSSPISMTRGRISSRSERKAASHVDLRDGNLFNDLCP